MQHSFDIDLAKEYGLLEAIILNNFQFWIEKNKANNTNYYDGYYWTYNSTKALAALFPYSSQRQIQNALKHLRDENILQTGNYNNLSYDRTLWYAFTEKGKCIMQKCKMDYANKGNGECKNVKPIPDNKPDNKPNNKKIEKEFENEFETLWEIYPRKVSKKEALKCYIRARKNGVDYDIVKRGIENYNQFIRQNGVKKEYIKHGSTWFNQECWNDEYNIKKTEVDDEILKIFRGE